MISLLVMLFVGTDTALADGPNTFMVNQRTSARIDSSTCHWGLIRRTTVTVQGSAIELECRGLLVTKGYLRDLNDLKNISWQSGLWRGKILATDTSGGVFYISMPKAYLSQMKEALGERL